MRSKVDIRCCAEQCVIMSLNSAGHWYDSLPAVRIYPMNRRMLRFPTQLRMGLSRFLLLARSLGVRQEQRVRPRLRRVHSQARGSCYSPEKYRLNNSQSKIERNYEY